MSALAEHVADAANEAAALAGEWEILAVDRRDTAIDVGSGTADAALSAVETTLCVRVVADGRVGTATTSRPSDARAAVRDAMECARHGPPAPAAAPAASRTPQPSAAPLPGSPGQAAAGVRELAAGLGALQSETGLDVHGTASHTWQTMHRAAPEGASASWQEFYHLSAVAEGRNSGLALPWAGWTRKPALPPGLRGWLELAATWDKLPCGMPVPDGADLLLAPAAVHTLLAPVVASLSGAAAAAGRSFLPGRLTGNALLNPCLTLADERPPSDSDQHGTDGLAWPESDDEGVACAPLILVDHGVPVRRYHSRHTAAAAGEEPTGHGFRGNALRRAMLRPINPVLNGAVLWAAPERTVPLADLLAAMRSGILVESLLGGQQRNGLSPVVQGRVRLGLVIRDGQVVGTARPGPLAMDLREVLGTRFCAISGEQQAVSRTWSARLPFVMADPPRDRLPGAADV